MAGPQSVDPQAFRAFELANWDQASGPYATYWGSLTRQAIGPLLAAAHTEAGTEVLDVACGPGWVTAAASGRGARPIGVDFSPAMVQRARGAYPSLTFQVGDAEDLVFADGSFDAVAINFGLLHLGRPERAISEAHRVLRPGGRLAFTVWAPPHESVVFGIVLGAVGAHGDPHVPLPPGPPFFRYSDPEEASRLLTTAGFVEPTVDKIPQMIWRVESAEAVFAALYEGTARTAGLLRRQTPAQLAAIRAAVLDELGAYERDGAIDLPMPAVLSSATRH